MIQGSQKIIAWAQANPAGAAPAPAAAAGEPEPQARRCGAPGTIEDLERWEDHGATWRPLELTDERVVVELCTCYGEPVDVLQSEDAGAHRVRARAPRRA